MKTIVCPDCKGWRYKFKLSKDHDEIKNDVRICRTCRGTGVREETNQPVRSVAPKL